MSKTKTIKAWAVVDEHGDLLEGLRGYICGAVYLREKAARDVALYEGQRVVPVTVTWEEGR